MRWNEGKGWGAVELVGKYDVLNMSDSGIQRCWRLPDRRGSIPTWPSTRPGLCIIGASSLGLCGEQKTWIIGVNWYLNDYVRLMFDYAEAELSGYPLTTVSAGTTPHSRPATICWL